MTTQPIYLEAVTVSVGHADFLRETACHNQQHFDKWTVVTSEDDYETFEVCREFSIHSLTTDEFYRDGDEFNKGRGVQRGLNNISCRDWVLHLDADIALPPLFRQMLESAHLDPDCIYGADRMMVKSYEDWKRVERSNYRQHGNHCYIRPHQEFPIGVRWGSPIDGYVPCGFFQLWNGRDSIRRGIHHKPYPTHHNSAARSDIQFALQWDRRNRLLLPEVLVWHLESEAAPLGVNWRGRRTKRFGPPVGDQSRGSKGRPVARMARNDGY